MKNYETVRAEYRKQFNGSDSQFEDICMASADNAYDCLMDEKVEPESDEWFDKDLEYFEASIYEAVKQFNENV